MLNPVPPRYHKCACVMFSMPPANTIVSSPSNNRCAALRVASLPDPHNLFTVPAVRLISGPAFNPRAPP